MCDMAEWQDLLPNEDLDISVKLVSRKTALLLRLDARLMERLKWKERRVKVQVSLAPKLKRIRLTSAPSGGWTISDKKSKGAEISVRQLLPSTSYIRKCEASVENDALVIRLPDDFELKNPAMVVG